MKNQTAILQFLSGLLVCTTLNFCTFQRSEPIKSQQLGAYDENYAVQIERARNIVAPVTRRGAGVSIAVSVDGQLVWSEGFGYNSLERATLVQHDEPFRLYSLMKQVTAVLALQSVLNGEIEVDSTSTEIMPTLPEAFSEVTLRQLLTHTSGVRHYYHPVEASFFNHCDNAQMALERFVHDPLDHQPGLRQSYSTYGFVLASAMLETASGLSFPELVMQRITGPLELKSFQLEDRNQSQSALQFYDVNSDGKINPALPVDNSCKMGGGGYLASAEDLVRFYNAVMNEEIVPEPYIRQLLGGRSILEGSGSGIGGEAYAIADLNTRVSVVVLSNSSGLEQQIALERVRNTVHAVFDQSNTQLHEELALVDR